MKAKRITKLRKRIKHFRMWESAFLFGIDRSRIECDELAIRIYGLDHEEAVRRYYAKRPFRRRETSWYTTTSEFAKIAVLQDGEPLRNIKFYH